MTTAAHSAPGGHAEGRRRLSNVLVPEMWASLAIAAMWLAVLFDALFGPDIVVQNASGMTSVPSSVVVAFFAYLGTRIVARSGLRRSGDTS